MCKEFKQPKISSVTFNTNGEIFIIFKDNNRINISMMQLYGGKLLSIESNRDSKMIFLQESPKE